MLRSSEVKEGTFEGQFCFVWKQLHGTILIKERKITTQPSRFIKVSLLLVLTISMASFETPVKAIKENAHSLVVNKNLIY